LPELTKADIAQLKALAVRLDSEIDFSDIPELTDEQLKNAVRGRFYRPVRKQVTARLDADVLDWLKKQGKGYQSRMNAILRREMLGLAQINDQISSEPSRNAVMVCRIFFGMALGLCRVPHVPI
jgi:uncharacterized protein (DUF4415 family)